MTTKTQRRPSALLPVCIQQCSDADLLDAWTQDQLADAFAVLVERHGVMVWTVCRRKCRTIPLQQMAEHFQITLGSIRGRLQRGKKLLATRLRRRGIAPLLAAAAAGATNLSAGEAVAASSTLLAAIESGSVPSPPIPENLLSPLVTSVKRLMTPWNAAGGLTAVGTIAAMLVLPGSGSADGRSGDAIGTAGDHQ